MDTTIVPTSQLAAWLNWLPSKREALSLTPPPKELYCRITHMPRCLPISHLQLNLTDCKLCDNQHNFRLLPPSQKQTCTLLLFTPIPPFLSAHRNHRPTFYLYRLAYSGHPYKQSHKIGGLLWLASFTFMFSRFIHVTAGIGASFSV